MTSARSSIAESLGAQGASMAITPKFPAGVLILFGVIELFIGMVAISVPFIAGTATILVLGSMLVFVAIIGLIRSFSLRAINYGLWGFVISAMALIAGIVTLMHPMLGLETVTLWLGAYFFIAGVAAVALSLKLRNYSGWGWMTFNGVVTLLLAVMIFGSWPHSSLWLLGTLIGVDILLTGFASLSLGFALRRLSEPSAA